MSILLIKKSREPERPVASVRSVQDVTDRPRNELIVVVVDVVVVVVVVVFKRSCDGGARGRVMALGMVCECLLVFLLIMSDS